MMKKTLSLFLCLVLMMSLCSTAMAIGDCGAATSPDDQCYLYYKHITGTRTHELYCSNHGKTVADSVSDCEVDAEDECRECHFDYTPDPTNTPSGTNPDEEAMSLEMMMVAFNYSSNPIAYSQVSGMQAELGFSDEMLTIASTFGAEMGISLSESYMVPTTYTLSLTNGTTYSYTGAAIEPVTLKVNHDTVGNWLKQYGDLEISDVTYTNNIQPGTATAKVTFTMPEFDFSEELSVNFTITGTSSGDGDTDSGDSAPEQFTIQTITSGDAHLYGALTPDARLIVTPIGTGHSDYQKLAAAATDLANGMEPIAAYDVSILGEYVGEMELGFVVDDKYLGKELTILHGKSDGLVESHTVTVTENRRGTCAIIRIDSLSPFMLLGEKAEATPTPVPAVTAAPTQAPEATTAPGGSVTAAPTATLTPTETPGAVELPATGDSSQLALWMALLLVSCIGVMLLNAAKRTGRQ